MWTQQQQQQQLLPNITTTITMTIITAINKFQTNKPQLNASIFYIFFLFCVLLFFSAAQEDPLSCQVAASPSSLYYPCQASNKEEKQDHQSCKTFAVFHTNPYYSSLQNLSSQLGITPSAISEANGFPPGTELLPINQLLLIPLDCNCNNGIFFEAYLTKTTTSKETLSGIARSLEGLTTCRAIQAKNPTFSFSTGKQQVLRVPVKCACPSVQEIAEQKTKLLLSYPVSEGDTIDKLALRFNTTPKKLISANTNRSLGAESGTWFLPFSTILIPAEEKPKIDFLLPNFSIKKFPRTKKARKMRMTRVYIALGTIAFVAIISIGAAFFFLQWRKRKNQPGADLELQKLSLSVRTTSEKKVSFEEGSNADESSLNGQQSFGTVASTATAATVATTVSTTTKKKRHHSPLVETFSLEELRKATEEFSSANLIEGSVYHGRLNGKNLAIKKTSAETMSKIEFVLFQEPIVYHQPNILRLLGTCSSSDDSSSSSSSPYLVFEYAKNGSLKDWLHGKLAVKSQFIESCYCFLNWNQRLRICLDVATALQFMHQVMNPPYVHMNIKSKNIFLDEEFNAKLGNFGMAKCAERNRAEDEHYLAPEYVGQGLICPGIDVFAFGMVLLEVLSGKAVKEKEKIKVMLKSEEAAEELREWMDKALGDNYSFDGAVTLANLARACVEDDPSLRPNAGEIIEKLSRLVEEEGCGDSGGAADELGFVPGASICESSSKPLVKAAAEEAAAAAGGGGS